MIFQPIYNWIKNIKTPEWYKILMADLQDLILQILVSVGKAYIEKLQEKILDVSKSTMSNRDKFTAVFKYGKQLLPTVKDSALNMTIEILFNRLKEAKVL